MTTPEPLAGQTALVTGGASGIGRAAALTIGRAGAAVAVVDLDEEGAAKVVATLASEGCNAVAVQADLSDARRTIAVVPEVVAALGRVDILVNCAGIHPQRATVLELEEDVWDRVHAINVKAPFLLVQAFARHAVGRGGGGRIVNLSSSGAFRAGGNIAYSSTKAALGGLTRSAAGELAPHGITVNAVAPGITRTRMALEVFGSNGEIDRIASEGVSANLFARATEPEEVAESILFLCLPASRQITGQVLHVSAGAVV